MVKDIKTKEVIKDIKVVDKKKNLDYFEKKNNINTKQSMRNDDHSHQQMTPKNYTVDKTILTGKTAVINAGKKNRQVMKRNIRIKAKRKIKSRNDIVQKDISTKSKNASHHSQLKIKQSLPYKNVDFHDYNKRMKFHVIGKHKNKVKEVKETTSRFNAGARTSV